MTDATRESAPALVKAAVKIDKAITTISTYCGIMAFTIMSVVILAGVVMRFVLKMPNMWGEEISRYMMVLGVYFGVACGCRSRSHLAVEGLVAALPPKAAFAVRLSAKLIIIAAYAFLTWLVLRLGLTQLRMGQTSPAMRLPMWIVYAGMVVAFLFSAITELLLFINDFVAKRPFLQEDRKRGFE
jgi:C4-dicarboxylate transporter DctQ subunit